ncbi:MAG TPA: sensor histidine kinase [Verrucomicrobiae bacterium]
MNRPTNRPLFPPHPREFLATVWPPVLATDSELQRRIKSSVRYGQLAVAGMLVFAVAFRIAAAELRFFWPQAIGLALATVAYVIWFLAGLRETVRWMLWDNTSGNPPAWRSSSGRTEVFCFTILFALAGLVCVLQGRDGGSLLVWLVLLPPVSLSVFRLRWPGVAVVTGASLGILAAMNAWRGRLVSPALLEFSCGALFALLFPALAVTSEKARGEVERLAGKLSEANQKLREYAVQTEELAVTRERNRLAREIHDSIGHSLTVVNVQLEAARALLASNPARVEDALNKAQTLTQQGLQDIRRSVGALRGSPVDDQPLAEALRQMVNQSGAGGLAVEMEVRGEPRVLSPPARLTLYRAGQEGLTNARKHARAARVRLTLDFQSAAKVTLTVTDDGPGADGNVIGAGGFGLLGLRERAQLLGGAVRAQTSPGAGFTLAVEVPG